MSVNNVIYSTDILYSLHNHNQLSCALRLRNGNGAPRPQVQRLTASMAGWKTFIQSALPAVIILFVGSWSDRHGRRKPCMLFPIVGEFLTSLGLLVCTYFYKELPIQAVTVSGRNKTLAGNKRFVTGFLT